MTLVFVSGCPFIRLYKLEFTQYINNSQNWQFKTCKHFQLTVTLNILKQ